MISEWPGLVARAGPALIEDCLVLVPHLGAARKVVDVGSGGGLPGIPLKIVRPDLELTLIEADQEKAAFLVHACARLGLDGVEVVARRAEEAGHDPRLREAFDLAEPYLDMLGSGVTYVGDGEEARTVKLCHNLILGVVAQSLAEITILAEKSGISRQAFLECLNKSVMGSLFTGYKTPAYVNLDFEPTFTATLLRKDFDLGLAAAREHEVPMPVAAVVHQLIQGLVGRGYGDADFAALLQQQADSAGLTLVSEHADVSDGLGTSET